MRNQNIDNFFMAFGEEDVLNFDYLEHHAYMYARRPSVDNAVKRIYLNFEIGIKVYAAAEPEIDTPFFVLDRQMIKEAGLTESAIWKAAERNTRNRLQILGYCEFVGIPSEQELFYIFTTDYLQDGCVGMVFTDYLSEFCREHGETDLYLLPSSSMECLILRGSVVSGMMSAEELAGLVSVVNQTEVSEDQRMEPVSYRYTLMDNTVRIVGRCEEASA